MRWCWWQQAGQSGQPSPEPVSRTAPPLTTRSVSRSTATRATLRTATGEKRGRCTAFGSYARMAQATILYRQATLSPRLGRLRPPLYLRDGAGHDGPDAAPCGQLQAPSVRGAHQAPDHRAASCHDVCPRWSSLPKAFPNGGWLSRRSPEVRSRPAAPTPRTCSSTGT